MGRATFRPEYKHSGKQSKHFDACVSSDYNEMKESRNGRTTIRVKKVCYGVITKMFLSSCGVEGVPADVVIQARWYAVVGTDDVTGLPRVAYRYVMFLHLLALILWSYKFRHIHTHKNTHTHTHTHTHTMIIQQYTSDVL